MASNHCRVRSLTPTCTVYSNIAGPGIAIVLSTVVGIPPTPSTQVHLTTNKKRGRWHNCTNIRNNAKRQHTAGTEPLHPHNPLHTQTFKHLWAAVKTLPIKNKPAPVSIQLTQRQTQNKSPRCQFFQSHARNTPEPHKRGLCWISVHE